MNKSGIRFGQKKYLGDGDDGDTREKFCVIRLLRTDYGLFGLTGEVVMIPRTGKPRYPDILIKHVHPKIAILLHGDAHTEGSRKELDVKRDYDSANVKLIIVWEALTNYTTEKIMEVLDANGLKRKLKNY